MESKEENKRNEEGERGKGPEGLPTQESPYVKYKDIEDYKRHGYGAEGHLEPKQGRGAGATDGPTPSGAALVSEAQFKANEAHDAMKHQVP